jgi:hypothetical protein
LPLLGDIGPNLSDTIGYASVHQKLVDAIAAHGRGVEQARELHPAIPPSSVTSAAHRLSSDGALTLHRNGKTIVYSRNRVRNP